MPGKSVFVWRAQGSPRLGIIGEQCIYCKGALRPGGHVDPITQAYLATAQRQQFGKLLSELSSEDWEPFQRSAAAYNRTECGAEYPLPESLEDAVDYFFGVNCNLSTGVCARCGWWLNCIVHQHGASVERTACAQLREFDINGSAVALPEIESHLRRHFSDVYHLSPRKFEELISLVYRQLGWRVTLTKQSRDGGYDLFCLQDDTGKVCLVECKRYSRERRIGISAIDRLLGVLYRNSVTQAQFVTTSGFTHPARVAVAEARERGIILDLVDAHQLSKLFEIYSDPDITVKDISRIFADVDP